MCFRGGSLVSILLGNGGGTFTPQTRTSAVTRIAGLAAGDFTGDGRPDVLTTTASMITVTPAIAPNTLVADPAVSVANGVLTAGPGNVTLDAVVGVPNELLVTTATRQTWLAADAITQVVLSGAVTLNTDLGRLAGNPVALTVNSSATSMIATSQHLTTLTVMGSATVTAGGGRVLRVASLSTFSGGRLDLNDNALIYDYDFGSGTAQRSAIRNLIKSARAGGAWTGTGLISTAAKNTVGLNTTLGYMGATDYKAIYGASAKFDGEVIDDSTVLVRYTLYGDADFSRTVDFNDFLKLQNGFGSTNASFALGDFDYSGVTDFNDFLILQNNFDQTLPSAVIGGGAAVPVVVPPPPASAVAKKIASISGVAFNDSNRNGKYDKGDSVAAGKTIWLDLDNDGVKDGNEPGAVTDAHGRYTFKKLAAGKYHVRRLFAAGYSESTPVRSITLATGQAASNVYVGSQLRWPEVASDRMRNVLRDGDDGRAKGRGTRCSKTKECVSQGCNNRLLLPGV